MSKKLKYTWIPITISLIIFYLCCLIPTDDVPDVEIDFIIEIDKIIHFIMYFGLSITTAAYYIYDKKGKISIPKLLIGAILLPILYAGLIEIIQANCFPPRSGDWYDFWAGMLGSLFALPFICYFRENLLKRKSK